MKNVYKISLWAILFGFIAVSCNDEEFFDIKNGGKQLENVNPPRSVPFLYQQTTSLSYSLGLTSNGNTISSVSISKQLITSLGKSDVVTIDGTSGEFSQSLAELFADVPVGGNVLTENDLLPGDYWEMGYTMTLSDGTVLTPATVTEIPFSCPLGADFTGMYTIEDVDLSAVGGATMFGPGPVELTEESTFERTFEAVYLPTFGIGNGPVSLTFKLECEKVIFGPDQNSGLQCANGILFSTSDNPSSFDPADDSSFEVTLLEDSSEDCGPATDVTIRFVKVE